MNNNCQYANGAGCLCSACQAARKAMEDAEKVTKEEVDKLFADAEKLLEECKVDAEAQIWSYRV